MVLVTQNGKLRTGGFTPALHQASQENLSNEVSASYLSRFYVTGVINRIALSDLFAVTIFLQLRRSQLLCKLWLLIVVSQVAGTEHVYSELFVRFYFL